MDWIEQYEHRFDVAVSFTLLTAEEGGFVEIVQTGFMRQFYYDGHDWDAKFEFQDTDVAVAGEKIKANISFLSPQCHVGKLQLGKEFLIRVGQRIIGRGQILQILNLEENAERMRRLMGNCDDPLPPTVIQHFDPRPKYRSKKHRH